MTLTAFFLILISVFLHAGWNFLSKSCSPSGAFYFLATCMAVLLWLPFFCLGEVDLRQVPGEFWIFLVSSALFELLYFIGLAHAYRTSDISMAYPLARALPVLMVAAVTMVFALGKMPGALALGGMAIVSAGCLILPLKQFRGFHWSVYFKHSILFILLAAIGTTGYTVLDSQSMVLLRQVDHGDGWLGSITFLFMMESSIAVGLGAYVWCVPDERRELKRLFGKTVLPLVSGLFSSSAYALILVAMGHVNNVSYVQAFRQMSLPVGVLAGIFILHENRGKPKIIGVVLVVAGLIIVALGS